jgi:hypothetical protein
MLKSSQVNREKKDNLKLQIHTCMHSNSCMHSHAYMYVYMYVFVCVCVFLSNNSRIFLNEIQACSALPE